MNPIIRALAEAMGAVPKPVLVEATGETIDPDDDLFRRISGSRRDLSPIDQDRARRISLYLYRRNPMAKRLVNMIVDFVVGEGLTLSAPDPRVRQLANDWWSDPVMQLDLRHRDIVRDLLLNGELAALVAVNPVSGNMRLGFLDAERIEDVLPDPDNVMVDRTLMLRGVDTGQATPVPLVTFDDVSEPGSPRWVGEAFYFGLSRVLGQHRGTPFLLAIADYLDGYDQLLFNALERSSLINAFVYDVTIKGADDAAIAAWMVKHGAAPPPGSVRVHNDSEVWDALAPDLGNADTVALGRAIKNMGLGGAGVPEAWFAEGDSANRATLAAQGDPTYKMLSSLQRFVRAMFERCLVFRMQLAKAAGQLPEGADTTVTVNAPELSTQDTSKISGALQQLTNALVAARADGLIDTSSARRVFLSVVSQLGVDLTEADVTAAIEKQRPADLADTEARIRAAAGLGSLPAPGGLVAAGDRLSRGRLNEEEPPTTRGRLD